MKVLIIVLLFQLVLVFADKWPCNKKEAIAAFKTKKIQNFWPTFKNNPYENQTKESEEIIKKYLKDETTVCALQYVEPTKKVYKLRDFPDNVTAVNAGFIVTHQGRCGACSNLEDLAVYLERNLTKVVRGCGAKTIGFLIRRCLRNLGFTTPCVDIWQYNIYNTRWNCLGVCVKAWIKGTPFNKPDGSLNDCLQCDEDKSGPVFKYYAGRTRRNSGITSAIHRPNSQVYKMNHCYY